MTESGVIDKIVVIMESETIFSIHCQEQAFSLFEKITNNDIVNEYLVKDETFCLFLFRQMTKISKAFEDENEIDQFAKAKNVIFTRMLSQLTKENVFMEQNRKKLNKEKIFDMISNDKSSYNGNIKSKSDAEKFDHYNDILRRTEDYREYKDAFKNMARLLGNPNACTIMIV